MHCTVVVKQQVMLFGCAVCVGFAKKNQLLIAICLGIRLNWLSCMLLIHYRTNDSTELILFGESK